MNLKDAKALVRLYPKFICGYRRQGFSLKNVTKVHWVLYEKGNQMAASIGDGQLYRLKTESTLLAGPGFLTPDLQNIVNS